MSIKNYTVKQKRTAIRKYYEGKYQKLIEKEYNDYIDAFKKGKPTISSKYLGLRTKFLNREKNNLLDQLDNANSEEVRKLYYEIFY